MAPEMLLDQGYDEKAVRKHVTTDVLAALRSVLREFERINGHRCFDLISAPIADLETKRPFAYDP